MTVCVEVTANWRKLCNWQATPKNFPDIDVLEGGREPQEPTLSRVYISLADNPDLNLIEVRDWLAANAMGKCAMFGRFNYEMGKYQIIVDMLGVTFDFVNEGDAFFFKMRW